MTVRLGEMLVSSGLLTLEQVDMILERQQQEHKPFGLLCERLCGISPEAVEEAWAGQYASLTRTIDPASETYDQRALDLITRRQAWQFRLLPIRFDEPSESGTGWGELMIATTPEHLRRALRFAGNVLGVPLYFVMADPRQLGEALCRHYPLPGMTADAVNDSGMDHFIRAAG